MKIIPVLKAVLEIVPLIGQAIAIFRRRKAQKECRKIEHSLESVIRGVQWFRDYQPKDVSDKLRHTIETMSSARGTEDVLKPLVKKYTKK